MTTLNNNSGSHPADNSIPPSSQNPPNPPLTRGQPGFYAHLFTQSLTQRAVQEERLPSGPERNLGDFRVKARKIRTPGAYATNKFIGVGVSCNFYDTDHIEETSTVLEASLYYASREQDGEKLCTHVASILNVLNRVVGMKALQALESVNINPIIIKLPLPEDSDHYVIDQSEYQLNAREAHVLIGVIIFMLFKNITQENYAGYMTKRVMALSARVGIDMNRGKMIGKIFSLKQAQHIKTILGNHLPLKKAVFKYCDANENGEGSDSIMCRYVKHILSWSELTLYQFIYNKIVIPNSPILFHLSIQDEVLRFAETMENICASPQPQYFRYLCRGDQEELLMRSRIPILGAVAHAIKNTEEENPTTERFQGTLSKHESKLVDQLVLIHLDFMNTQEASGPSKARAYLTSEIKYPEPHITEIVDEEAEEGII